ncbi:MAG: signal peptidase II [Lachnospiraceae bacterium]|nr:signal peptidase II [Lachnospiraceae bacterium]
MNTFRIKRIIKCILSIIALVILDQLAKSWAVDKLKDTNGIDLIKGVLQFYYLPNGNTGAAFGMLQGHQSLFLFIALILSIVLLFIIYNIPNDKKYNLMIVTLTLIIAGGIGNMIDRMTLNYVIDFIYFSLINFPIFNVADMYVSVGTIMLVILFLFYYKEDDITNVEKSIKSVFIKNK